MIHFYIYSLVYPLIPIDFEKQSLGDRLQEVGFKADEPSFFSWLGVTINLTGKTVLSTMKYLTSSSGSVIIFDYTVPPSSQYFIRRFIFRLLAHKMAVIGEPWQTFFDPQQLTKEPSHTTRAKNREVLLCYFGNRLAQTA